jgi:hypothetical protein
MFKPATLCLIVINPGFPGCFRKLEVPGAYLKRFYTILSSLSTNLFSLSLPVQTIINPLNFIQKISGSVKDFFAGLYRKVAGSPLVKTLLLIIIIKFMIFSGFLKRYLYPRYLKPKYENEQHRSDEVIKDLINNKTTYKYE